VMALSFTSATLLYELTMNEKTWRALEFEEKPEFTDLMWWSFRQIEDPGNLVQHDSHLGILAISFTLTITGLLLFTFMIGIGTNVVKEMMDTAREQAPGLSRHSILLNAGPSSEFFMNQIIEYSRKQLISPKWMIMGRNDESTHRKLQEVSHKSSHINFRSGTAYNPQDLQKVDAATAKRFVILADQQDTTPDAETISAIMSARQLNPNAQIVAEIYNRKNSSAAETAATNSNIVVVETEYLLALLMANIIEMPQAFPVIEEMLNTEGQEMSSYVFKNNEQPLGREYFSGPDGYKKLVINAYRKNGSIIIGYSPHRPNTGIHSTFFSINAMQFNPGTASNALLGISSNFSDLKEIAQCAARGELQEEFVTNPMPKFSLKHKKNKKRKVLVCGYRHRIAVIAEHLIHTIHDTEIFIMLNNEEEIHNAMNDMVQTGISLAKYHKNHYSLRYQGQFQQSAEYQLIYNFDYGEGQAG
ncbi:MAG: NAD-binding protein, partial [Lentisphaeraceae bacterium]|nr:NAD-binding protein [Lentisphaeraceae bacterium]